MMSMPEEITERVNCYTRWLRDCPGAANLSIEPTSDKGPFPYQWKIGSADFSRFLGYVIFDGPEVGGSDARKKQHLCSLLQNVIRNADDKS